MRKIFALLILISSINIFAQEKVPRNHPCFSFLQLNKLQGSLLKINPPIKTTEDKGGGTLSSCSTPTHYDAAIADYSDGSNISRTRTYGACGLISCERTLFCPYMYWCQAEWDYYNNTTLPCPGD